MNMADFKVILGGNEYGISNTIPNSQIAAERQIEIAKKAIVTPDVETATEEEWKEYSKNIQTRNKEMIDEAVSYLARLLPNLTKKDIQNKASYKELVEATYVANCELLDWDYETPEERAAKRNNSDDSEKN